MFYENVENIVSLIAVVIGLLAGLFKYIRSPKRGYLYLIIFFLAMFLSDYYWTIYTLVIHDYPEVSEFLAYLGWNIAYLVLLATVIHMRAKGAKRYFHPLMLLPVLTNAPQFILYIQFGGIFNNVWQVGITTLTMIFCLQDILWYLKNRKNGAKTPHLSILALLFLLAEYAMWTVSCFDWPSTFANPYLYCALIALVMMVLFAWGAEKVYGRSGVASDSGWSEVRYQSIIQAIVTAAILLVCGAGYLIAVFLKNTVLELGDEEFESVTAALFGITAVLIILILFIILLVRRRFLADKKKHRDADVLKRNKSTFIITMAATLALMASIAVYNSAVLYNASVTGLYEDAKNVTESTSVILDNYLAVADTTLSVTADTVDLMESAGRPPEDILQYLTDQTKRRAKQFDENFTGLYAVVGGEFMDGSGWVPPEGYDPTGRDWYAAAVEAKGEVTIVSPYLDAQTGEIVITFAKDVSAGRPGLKDTEHNVVGLDVIVNYVQEVTESINISGKGYGMIVNRDGFIIAHGDRELTGQNAAEVYGEEVFENLIRCKSGYFDALLEEEDCMLFVQSVMDQWAAVVIINNVELYDELYTRLGVNILITVLTFLLIAVFYFFGYKVEQANSRKVERMSVQVVSSLAEAIDAKDRYTNGHSSRVAKYARMIAERAGYSPIEQDEIYMMGLLHDVGKIGIPDGVINKPGKLTPEEFDLIRQHPVIGGKILESIEDQPDLVIGAKWHHERYDGGGYPDGLAGERIPEQARIIAVADAYDAMTSRRSYRDMMSRDQVRAEIERGSGTQFDPRFAGIMLALIDEDRDYRLREDL